MLEPGGRRGPGYETYIGDFGSTEETCQPSSRSCNTLVRHSLGCMSRSNNAAMSTAECSLDFMARICTLTMLSSAYGAVLKIDQLLILIVS